MKSLALLSLALVLGCSAAAHPAGPALAPPWGTEATQAKASSADPAEPSPRRAKVSPLPPDAHALEPASTPAPEPQACRVPDSAAAPGLYARSSASAGRVALTFDDGPHPGKTPKVLDLLREHSLPATFFLVGHAIRKDTFRLVQRMVAEGHTLGTHSYNHDVKMALRRSGPAAVQYVRGQHEVTHILIELALLAQSESDFERLFTTVFDEKHVRYLKGGKLREFARFNESHRRVLTQYGYTEGERPYPILYSRPPGGNPYVGGSEPWQRAVYDEALRQLGHLNVLWHSESGDTDRARKHDFPFLVQNLERAARRGGVLLIHDYIRTDALTTALTTMQSSEAVTVVPLGEIVTQSFGCSPEALAQALAPSPSASDSEVRVSRGPTALATGP